MGELEKYARSLREQDLYAMYGQEGMYFGTTYLARASFAEPPRGDLLIVTGQDAKLLRDGEVIYRFSDSIKSADGWRREGSEFTLSTSYETRGFLSYFLRFFPIILQRDEVFQRHMRLIYHTGNEVIIKMVKV